MKFVVECILMLWREGIDKILSYLQSLPSKSLEISSRDTEMQKKITTWINLNYCKNNVTSYQLGLFLFFHKIAFPAFSGVMCTIWNLRVLGAPHCFMLALPTS